MIPEDLESLALADAACALDADEQRDLALRVAALSPEDQALVGRLYDTAIAVAASAGPVTPPAHVRAQVLAAAHSPGRYTLRAGDTGDWFDTPFAGIRGRVLAVDRATQMATLLLRAQPGAVYPSHHHHGAEECYVVRGSILIDGQRLQAGDFHHADSGSDHGEISTLEGAEVIIVGAIEDYLPGFE
jgi:quercetin dioxygenase-like cupin family protein